MSYSKVALTQFQKKEYDVIVSLQNLMNNATLNSSEMVHYINMTKKKKEKLVSEIYFKEKRKKEFYVCKDGRFKSYNPQFIAKSKEELIDKLFKYYFENTLEDVYKQWILERAELKIVSGKTLEEDIGLWNRLFADSTFAYKQITEIKPMHIMKLFQEWTGNGLITRKDFNNRKSLLNGIFRYAVENELITTNPILSLPCNKLKYKLPPVSKKAYTIEEKTLLLKYLKTLEPDAYILAIMLAFYGIFRIGEIKALSWNGEDANTLNIKKQLVEERTLKDDLTFGAPQTILKNPKGNPYYSIRTETISTEGLNILKKMKALNPDGEFLFMYEGRPLTTATFNRRLKKYCNTIGIPYLSSHKIRFTNASILYDAGVKATDIQKLLGHSTLAMTEHYIGQQVREPDNSQMAKILA